MDNSCPPFPNVLKTRMREMRKIVAVEMVSECFNIFPVRVCVVRWKRLAGKCCNYYSLCVQTSWATWGKWTEIIKNCRYLFSMPARLSTLQHGTAECNNEIGFLFRFPAQKAGDAKSSKQDERDEYHAAVTLVAHWRTKNCVKIATHFPARSEVSFH